MLDFLEYPDGEMVYLSRADVIGCCAAVDITAMVEAALVDHSSGRTILPDEAYLGWQTAAGHAARSLAMPGALRTGDGLVPGLKVINGSLGNPARGIARSQGLLMLFDPEIAWPTVLMESAYISAMRTAAVTAVSARRLARQPVRTVAVLGSGTLARAHLVLLGQVLPDLAEVRLYDIRPERSAALADALRRDPDSARLEVVVADDPQDCVKGADLVVPVTVVTEGYLRYDWFAPGALICHVSLDDVLPEVVARAGSVLVDDWNLVSHDHRRLLGRLYRQGQLLGPGGEAFSGTRVHPRARQVDGLLSDVLTGAHPGRTADDEVVLVNPFGMAVLDVALGAAVARTARAQGAGTPMPR